MLGEAKLHYLRISPRKVRLVADLIRRKPVLEAKNILSFTNKRSAPILLKLLNQAIANTKNQYEINEKETKKGFGDKAQRESKPSRIKGVGKRKG